MAAFVCPDIAKLQPRVPLAQARECCIARCTAAGSGLSSPVRHCGLSSHFDLFHFSGVPLMKLSLSQTLAGTAVLAGAIAAATAAPPAAKSNPLRVSMVAASG